MKRDDRKRTHGLLWFADGWSITDPLSQDLRDAQQRMTDLAFTSDLLSPEQKADLYRLLRAASDYQHLTTYELGIEHVVRKLRRIWRVLREG